MGKNWTVATFSVSSLAAQFGRGWRMGRQFFLGEKNPEENAKFTGS